MADYSTDTINWKETITPSNNIFAFNFKEIWNYRDLLLIWVKRDISSVYKQTVLGPLWFFLQPVLATLTYVIIFNKVGRLSTAGINPVLFYLSGIILWAYFSECIIKTASFLKDNSQIFSKVYFPRLIIPLSIILTNLIKFAIQFGLFLLVYIFFAAKGQVPVPGFSILFFPLLLFCIALFGFGAGIIVASLTIKYKDLSHLITFAIQLLMFVSTVFFPLESVTAGSHKAVIMANPMSGFIEAFRLIFLGKGLLTWQLISYDIGMVLLVTIAGVVLFNYTEKTFVDTI